MNIQEEVGEETFGTSRFYDVHAKLLVRIMHQANGTKQMAHVVFQPIHSTIS